MKNIEEIKKTPGIVIKKEGPDGFGGSVFPIEYKNGKVKVIKNCILFLAGDVGLSIYQYRLQLKHQHGSKCVL